MEAEDQEAGRPVAVISASMDHAVARLLALLVCAGCASTFIFLCRSVETLSLRRVVHLQRCVESRPGDSACSMSFNRTSCLRAWTAHAFWNDEQ